MSKRKRRVTPPRWDALYVGKSKLSDEAARTLVGGLRALGRRFNSEKLRRALASLVYELWKIHATEDAGTQGRIDRFLGLAAELGHFDAACKLLERELSPSATRFEAVFESGLAELKRHDNSEGQELEQLESRLLDLIRLRSMRDPHRALHWIGRLITEYLVQESRSDYRTKIRQAADDLLRKTGSGVYILDHIAPSDDRWLKPALARYQIRVEIPTPFAVIPNLQGLREMLLEEFPWCARAIEWIVLQLTVSAVGSGRFRLSPLLLLGPSGIGKNALVNRLAEFSGVPLQTLAVGGKADSRLLLGTARGWSTAGPGQAVMTIHEFGIANPLIVLDEIDKPGSSTLNGHIWDSLLAFLEPKTASKIYDEFLCGHADLSHINWIGTANDIARMPSTLLNRFRIIEIPPPAPEHRQGIILRCIKSFQQRHGIPDEYMPELSAEDWRRLDRQGGNLRYLAEAVERLLSIKIAERASHLGRH